MAGKASIENGRRGGRPPGTLAGHTLEAQEQRRILIATLQPHIEAITKALIKRAKRGDPKAAKELFDRAWGKAVQPLAGHDGGPLFSFDANTKAKVKAAWAAVFD